MSSNFWQIKKQAEQYGNGSTTIARIKGYVRKWEGRCYSAGIPDSVPAKLFGTGRVPSWHEIAILLLKNDLQLRGLGFSGKHSRYADLLTLKAKAQTEDLFYQVWEEG